MTPYVWTVLVTVCPRDRAGPNFRRANVRLWIAAAAAALAIAPRPDTLRTPRVARPGSRGRRLLAVVTQAAVARRVIVRERRRAAREAPRPGPASRGGRRRRRRRGRRHRRQRAWSTRAGVVACDGHAAGRARWVAGPRHAVDGLARASHEVTIAERLAHVAAADFPLSVPDPSSIYGRLAVRWARVGKDSFRALDHRLEGGQHQIVVVLEQLEQGRVRGGAAVHALAAAVDVWYLPAVVQALQREEGRLHKGERVLGEDAAPLLAHVRGCAAGSDSGGAVAEVEAGCHLIAVRVNAVDVRCVEDCTAASFRLSGKSKQERCRAYSSRRRESRGRQLRIEPWSASCPDGCRR